MEFEFRRNTTDRFFQQLLSREFLKDFNFDNKNRNIVGNFISDFAMKIERFFKWCLSLTLIFLLFSYFYGDALYKYMEAGLSPSEATSKALAHALPITIGIVFLILIGFIIKGDKKKDTPPENPRL